jgi:hypothetical protein
MQPNTTVAQAQPAPAQPEEPSALGQAWDRLKEATDLAGDAAREEAIKLRRQAQNALDNSGPLVEQGRRFANRLRDNLSESTEQAVRDLSAAAQDLDERIRAATGTPVETPSVADAMLPAPDELNVDTRAAAQPRPEGTVPDYVGVWAQTAAACARIDQDDAEHFAVITPTTIRRDNSVCNMASPQLVNGTATAQASCYADGNEEPKDIVLSMSSPDALRIGRSNTAQTEALVRCHLPK